MFKRHNPYTRYIKAYKANKTRSKDRNKYTWLIDKLVDLTPVVVSHGRKAGPIANDPLTTEYIRFVRSM